MANQFLDALTGSKVEPVTFQFFTDDKSSLPVGKDGKKKDPRASHRHMKRSPAYAFLLKKQKDGCGTFVMVNAGDGKGRKGNNVVKIHALFIDLDGEPWEPAAMALRPHIRVESSPGRWHLYWLVDDCSLGQFKAIQQAIARKFNGDRSCTDKSRVLRVPGFFHLKKDPCMTKLIEANDFDHYTTQQVIDGLGLELGPVLKMPTEKPKEDHAAEPPPSFRLAYAYTDPKSGEVIDLATWAAQTPGFDIVTAIRPNYAMGSAVDGKMHIVCPFADEHTDTGADLATFVANADNDHPSFAVHCMHSHCVDRDRLEFLQAMFERGWLSASVLIQAPVKKKRPPRVYMPVDEIHAAIEWTTLSAEEHRVALHVAELMLSDDDGTLPDNDWLISRSLGMTEAQWLPYRDVLTRSGWLITEEGRLRNSIMKREYDNAQTALMKAIISGRRGGYAKEANRSRVAMDSP
jgi:hypothetical protein